MKHPINAAHEKLHALASTCRFPLNPAELTRIYDILVEKSDLSEEAIMHEIESLLSHIEFGGKPALNLGIDEISFLIEHNRYQEKTHGIKSGGYEGIDVKGHIGDKYLFLISDSIDLVNKTTNSIQKIIGKRGTSRFSLSAIPIINLARSKDRRRLYVLEEQKTATPETSRNEAVNRLMSRINGGESVAERGSIDSLLSASTEAFGLMALKSFGPKTVARYAASLSEIDAAVRQGEDVLVADIDENPGTDHAETWFILWMPREKFQENYGTLNLIFERKGIPFNGQFFHSIIAAGRHFIGMATPVMTKILTSELREYLKNELYARSLLLKSAPVSVGEIREILETIAGARDYEKLELILTMQQNKQKEYLIPLVLLMNDPNAEIRAKAFGLIRHYVLNPDSSMKNDYYWSTLKNVFSAATVPIKRESDRLDRALLDGEIMNLLRFRNIFYERYEEPLTGKAYLFIRINGIGIGKGGIRAHEHEVTFSGEGALATNMLFKNIGLGVPWYTIGKGGILGDMKFAGHDGDTRAQARKNVLQSYADFLYYRAEVGPLSDVPAGDVGIGGEEISVIFDRITHNALSDITAIAGNPHEAPANVKKILGENFGVPCADASLLKKISSSAELAAAYTSPAITGKPGPHGLALRAGATSRGLIEVLSAQQNFQDYGDAALWSDPARITEALEREVEYRVKAESKLRMLSFSIQGFGKVGANLAKMIDEIGATVKMISDVSGTLSDAGGIKGIPALFDRCFKGGLTLQQAPREITGSAEFIPGDTVMPLKAIVDVVVPAAMEEVIVAGDQDESGSVHVSDFRGIYLLQGANGPATAEAEEALEDMGTVSFPDILANAGGVLASYLEWIKGLTAVFG